MPRRRGGGVLRKYWDEQTSKYTWIIGNARGRENGWCHLEHIHGVLTSCQH